ncbi:YusW family protein [Sporosarcina sp. 179-K 3D1 HS]|uniref:YusW family protein n=1 Tax=Sporosarcina sp. 179-K 3D1 HS TaxID=3232169 RepID=UPI0039A0AC61
MRKFTIASLLLLAAIFVIAGCGNFGKNADKDQREDADIIYEHEKEGGTMETGDGYGFTHFDLDIDVDGKDAIEADYEVDKELDVEYKNTLKGINVKGKEAMDELHQLFTALLLRNNMTKEEYIKRILTYYELDAYSKFDLEINFDDGTKLDIEDVK